LNNYKQRSKNLRLSVKFEQFRLLLIPGKVIVAEMISFAGLGDASGGTDGSVTVVTFVTVDVTFAVVVAGRLPFEIEPVGIRAGKIL
jgi:hypothetical protein